MSITTAEGTTSTPTQLIRGRRETYAYRRFGGGLRRPLVCLQHFTGTLDNWDPAVTDPLASDREVTLFDHAGIGRSTGAVPDTIATMAAHALDFIDALCLPSCDLLGFSLGGMVAQQIALERPAIVHRLILVGTAADQLKSWGTFGPKLRAMILLLRHSGLRIQDAACLERSRLKRRQVIPLHAEEGDPFSFVPGSLVALPPSASTSGS